MLKMIYTNFKAYKLSGQWSQISYHLCALSPRPLKKFQWYYISVLLLYATATAKQSGPKD